jgi:hypothetical protein
MEIILAIDSGKNKSVVYQMDSGSFENSISHGSDMSRAVS